MSFMCVFTCGASVREVDTSTAPRSAGCTAAAPSPGSPVACVCPEAVASAARALSSQASQAA
eukprot:6315955-Prymnesium_polylepis.1